MKSRNIRLTALLLCIVMCIGILTGCGAQTAQLTEDYPPMAEGPGGTIKEEPGLRYVEIHCPGGSFEGWSDFTVTLTKDGKLPQGFNWYQPERPGYKFLGWYKESEAGDPKSATAFKEGDPVPEEITDLYAGWVRVVVLDAAPGNFKDNPQQNYTRTVELVDDCLPMDLPTDPVFDYDKTAENQSIQFKGWYTKKSIVTETQVDGGWTYSVKPDGDHIAAGAAVPEGVITLYAGYESSAEAAATRHVTYKLNWNGAQGKYSALECSRPYGSTFDADNAIVTGLNVTGTWAEFEAAAGDKSQAAITKYWQEHPLNGYTFLGWYDEPVGGKMISIGAKIGEAIKDGQTLYAHYTYNGASSDEIVDESHYEDPDAGPMETIRIYSDLSQTAHPGSELKVELFVTPVHADIRNNDVQWSITTTTSKGKQETLNATSTSGLLAYGLTATVSADKRTLTVKYDDKGEGKDRAVTVSVQATKDDGTVIKSDVNATLSFSHRWEETGRQEAKCTEKGYIEYQCTADGCHATRRDSIPQLEHVYNTNVEKGVRITKQPTCTEPGEKHRVCLRCGAEEKEVYSVPATGHKWGEWIVTKPATPLAEGQEKRECSVCRESETRVIPKTAFELAAPEIETVTNTAKGVEITWDEVDGAEKYRVYSKAEGKDWVTLANTANTSYTWTQAESGTTYSFRVRCMSPATNAVTSGHDEDKSITFVAAPKNVKATAEANGIKVTWTKSVGAAKYRVFYKPAGGSWAKAADTTETSYLWTGAEKGTTYQIRVWCVSADGKTVTSGHDNIPTVVFGTAATPTPTAKPTAAPTAKPTAKPTEKPTAAPTAKPTEKPTEKPSGYELSAPTGVKAENAAKGIKVTWTKVTGAVKYRVFYKPEGGSWAKAGDTTSTSYTWTKAKSGTTYQIRVRCITGDGKTGTSDFSASKSLKYIAAPEYTLTSESKGIKVSWKKVTGAEKYRIYYKTAGGSWKTLVNTDETSYTWTGAKSGTKYTFRVRCVDSAEKKVTSYYGTDKSITYTKPASYQLSAPKIKTVSSASNGIKVTWGKVTGAVKYRVFYKPEGGSWTKAGDTTSTSFTWKGAKSGTTYQIRVRCISADGKTGTSDFSAVKTIAYKK